MGTTINTQSLTVCDTRLWGKTLNPTTSSSPYRSNKNISNENDSSGFYPVLAHLLDTAAVTRVLVDQWLPEHLVRTIATKLNATPDVVKNFIVYSAGVHDIGKITPAFQYQTFNKYARDAFKTHQHNLETVGYEKQWEGITGTTAEDVKHMVRRHEIGSGLFRNGGSLSPVMTPEGAVVAGHHGLYNIYDDYEEDGYSPLLQGYEYYSAVNNTSWGAQIKAHHEAVRAVLSYDNPQLTIPTPIIPLLTSIVCLADWIASSEESIENCRQNNHLKYLNHAENVNPTEYYTALTEYYKNRGDWLEQYTLNLLNTPNKPPSFAAAFPHIVEKTVAQKVLTEEAAHKKGLTIVMLPMGEGKTEGALGYWLKHAEEREGVFFALPTMATSDAMFDRIQSFFRAAPGTVGKLSHGRSVLNSFYDIPAKDTPVNSCDTDNCTDVGKNIQGSGLHPSGWFNGKHRALLAPIGVGTVDQLLASVLKHKYNFMRTLGIATKTVIIDEVHTFDAYQSSLLEKFLTWAHYHNVNVVLLSATLPSGKVKNYLNAYGNSSVENLHNLPYPAIINLAATEHAEPTVVDLSAHSTGREIELHISYAENIYETVILQKVTILYGEIKTNTLDV